MRLDVARLAADAETVSATWPVSAFSRLADGVQLPQCGGEPVQVEARGELRPVLGGEPEVWLHLRARAAVALTCQRCLGPVTVVLDVDQSIRLVATEALAAALDAELEEDVLVLQRYMDLRELAEDEFLLELPLIPRHDVCPDPLPLPENPELESDPAPHPFAALAGLKRGGLKS